MKLLQKWPIYLLRGVSTILLAIFLLVYGQQSMSQFIRFLGVFWTIIGITYLINARTDRDLRTRLLVIGTLTIFGGLVAFTWPLLIGQFDRVMLTVLGGALVVALGLLHIVGGFPAGSFLGRRRDWSSIFLGLLEVFLGVAALASPGRLSPIVIGVSIAFCTVFGLFLLFKAYQVWKDSSRKDL